MSAPGYDPSKKVDAAIVNQNQAQNTIDTHAQNVAATHDKYMSDIERKHDQAKKNLDDLQQKADREYQATHQGNHGVATGARTSGSATAKLDELREEQRRRYEQFSNSTNQANTLYNGQYGKTSFGTPVNKDGDSQARGFTDMHQDVVRQAPKASLKETEKLDQIREEQKKRFSDYSNGANVSHSTYHSNYGKTSFGTPVHSHHVNHPEPKVVTTTTSTTTKVYTIDHSDYQQPIDLNRFLTVLNDVRARPAFYADRIKQIYFKPDGKSVNHEHEPDYTEGSRVYVDGYEYLRHIRPLAPLRLDAGLTAAAYDQAVFMSHNNKLSYQGPNRETIVQRATRYGTLATGNIAENTCMTRDCSYEVIILNMIIDDGVPNRGRRLNIFSPEFTRVGLAAAKNNPHAAYFIDIVFGTDGYNSNIGSLSSQTKAQSGLDFYFTQYPPQR